MKLKEKINEYKIYIIAITIILGLIAFNIYTLTLIDYEEEEPIIPVTNKEKPIQKIKVDIKGEINAPGVYELNKNDRVNDLINKAGGITKNGDTSIINLSKKLEDEMLVIIYSKNEVNKLKTNTNQTPKDICPKINNACPEKELETITGKENQQAKENNNEKNVTTKISINKATAKELQNLDGIGEAKAEAIVKYREENGNFKKLEDIKNVSGIGDSAFAKIKDKITL
ncbi:MAG: helix-hairpin-helix domain-containing protein [Bacilli bacterium]|nr:helix-hairpin-helix domain-containing protein [Bacilli bacterium]